MGGILHVNFTVSSMYQYLINQGTPFMNKFIWKLKIPLKIKIFLWYIQRVVILIKGNLAKRNWFGSMKCCFCDKNETIRYLFLDYQYAKAIWRVLKTATGLTQPRSINHMMWNWLTIIDNKTKQFDLCEGCW
jgi:hypothetical protein